MDKIASKLARGIVATSDGQPLVRLAYSVSEAAAVTGLGRTTLYGLIAQGSLPSRKIGKRRIIRGVDLEALVGPSFEGAE